MIRPGSILSPLSSRIGRRVVIVIGTLLFLMVLLMAGPEIVAGYLNSHQGAVAVFRYAVYTLACWWGPKWGGLTGIPLRRVRTVMIFCAGFVEIFAVHQVIRI